MNYYKDSNNQVYAYNDLQVAQGFVKEGLTLMTPEEVEEHLNPTLTLEQLKENKFVEIGQSFNAHVKGSFVCSLGYPMQFNESDSLKMEGSIILMEVRNVATGYLTDAEDVTHYDVALADIKSVKIQMLMEYAVAHQKKQILRQEVKDAETQADLDLIAW